MKKLLFNMLVLLIAIACFAYFRKEEKSDGGWHLLVPHNQGWAQEDPDGCPCECLMLGWSSYANMTNAAAHGIRSPFDEAKKRGVSTNGVVSLLETHALGHAVAHAIRMKKGGAN